MTIPRLNDPARIIELTQAYLEAEYRWTLDGDWHDLRIGLPAPGLELAHPGTFSFGCMSAWNPQSILRADDINRAEDQLLHDALETSGLVYRAAFASAPNRSWKEPSWIVMDMPLADFDALADRHGQLGTLWWTTGMAVRLRMSVPQPEGFPDDPHIDWLK
jgi:hypothetical protein